MLQERIAAGGMSDVWRGLDDVLQREVAVKVMRADPDNEEIFAARFRDEALHSAALMHTNITTVFDYGEDDHLTFLVMELVPGLPLSAIIREQGPLDPDSVRSIIGQAALALGVAHEARVVHRDVKPANILVRPDGVVKLTDFGIARALDAIGHTRVGEMLGTPNYISPEQAMGEQATGASDLYALGVVAHEMLNGAASLRPRHPHRHGACPTSTSRRRRCPTEVPVELRAVVEALLEKKPADRPANARAVAQMLGIADNELSGLAEGLATSVSGEYVDDARTPVTDLPTMSASADELSTSAVGQRRAASSSSAASAAGWVNIGQWPESMSTSRRWWPSASSGMSPLSIHSLAWAGVYSGQIIVTGTP